MSDVIDAPNLADAPISNDLLATAPGQLRVIRRNGKVTAYDDSKIMVALTKAFLAIEGGNAAASTRVHSVVEQITQHISENFIRRMPMNGIIHIEDIQDQVELGLMRAGEYKIARAYVLYREEHRKKREQEQHIAVKEHLQTHINVTLDNGSKAPLDINRLTILLQEACSGLAEVDPTPVLEDTLRNLYDGVSLRDVSMALMMAARTRIEMEPNYSFVAARLLLDVLRAESLSFLNIASLATASEMKTLYPKALKTFIERGVELNRLNPELAKYNLDVLGKALLPERDFQFGYLGLQTLYDRYFIHYRQTRYELPQVFFMRVAMGLALQEANREEKAIEFYRLLSSFDFMSSTPTLFNSGTTRAQLSSCFLTTVSDDLENIFLAIRDNALLSKFAGGLGNDWTPVRAMGSYIEGTNGNSSGVVPFLSVANATAVAVNQGGKRKGAVCAYLETWHLDIEEFLELRKNTGDERRRTHDMNTANWVPDLFMERLFNDDDWTLFSPNEVPDLHDLHGAAFKQRYEYYENKIKNATQPTNNNTSNEPEVRHFKIIKARDLWRKMLSMLFETGHPWITFKDPCNIRSPQQHIGVVHSSNLCTEITLNTSKDEIAVCNLGSINLAAHITNGALDKAKLKRTVTTAIRMLDNVIDMNYYAVPQARNSNLKHRPVGLGLMGFQDALYKLEIDYASDAAVKFADESMELISYYAILASSTLAKEHGPYESYEGSLWSRGILPIDSIALLKENRGEFLKQDTSHALDWDSVRKHIKQHGMRNSNVMAIAPTATIANICGVSQSIEPTYQNLFVKSNLSGEFTVVNPYLVRDLKLQGLWDEVMVNDLKYYNGSIQSIHRIPDALKKRYATAFEINAEWLIQAASRRQKWIDQAQSLNLYIAQPSGKLLDQTYRSAWLMGLKTTYYLRSLSASSTEKVTVTDGVLNAVSPTAPLCSIDNPDCEACQ